MSTIEDMMFDSMEDMYLEDESETLIGITVVTESLKSYLIEYKGKECWFPKSISQVSDDAILYDGWFEPNWTAPFKPNTIEGDFE